MFKETAIELEMCTIFSNINISIQTSLYPRLKLDSCQVLTQMAKSKVTKTVSSEKRLCEFWSLLLSGPRKITKYLNCPICATSWSTVNFHLVGSYSFYAFGDFLQGSIILNFRPISKHLPCLTGLVNQRSDKNRSYCVVRP